MFALIRLPARACALTACAALTAPLFSLTAQSGRRRAPASEWSAPATTDGSAGGLHGSLGYLREIFPAGARMRDANGLAGTVGWGHDQRFQRQILLGYSTTRTRAFEGVTPGQLVSSWQLEGGLGLRVLGGATRDVRLTAGAGLRDFSPQATVGAAQAPSTTRWQMALGSSVRMGGRGPASVIADVRRVWSNLATPAFASTIPAPAGTQGWWQWRAGVSLHRPAATQGAADLRRYPQADAPLSSTPVLEPETGAATHVDGAAPLTAAGRPNARYAGPMSMTIYFKHQTSAFSDNGDYDKLVRLAKIMAETPGTVMVLRSWETPGPNPVQTRQMAEQRANRLRDIILAAAPFASPQRVTSIMMGGDFATADDARTRRIDIELFRP